MEIQKLPANGASPAHATSSTTIPLDADHLPEKYVAKVSETKQTRANFVETPASSGTSQTLCDDKTSQMPKGFLANKEESLTGHVQFIQSQIMSAKEQCRQMEQQADKYDQIATKCTNVCSNCHLTGITKENVKTKYVMVLRIVIFEVKIQK